ncbi:MAG: hypothetical protein PHG66_01140 [Candidatus Colwellbacteria bacterium]|nr:hypothetical protein [Candidatus Colwellbacteria bacterium]
MSSLFKNNLTRLQEDLSEAEENVAKKRKLVETENVSITDKWFSDKENLKQWVIEKKIYLNFVGVEKGKLLYSKSNNCINNDGSYSYRIYEILCRLSPNHKVFDMPSPHTYIHASDVIDNLEFRLLL